MRSFLDRIGDAFWNHFRPLREFLIECIEQYTLATFPTIGTQMAVDTGWTANSTAGDKTAVLTGFTNNLSGTMVTALNLSSPGMGTTLSGLFDTVVLVVKKLAAIETALVAAKLPNA